MYRGTTPTNTFRTTVDLSSAEVMYITYGQRGETVVEKEKADITFDVPQEPGQIKNKSGSEEEPTIYSFSVNLTQEETLRFSGTDVYIQVRARFPGETAIASKVIKTTVQMILKDGVI